MSEFLGESRRQLVHGLVGLFDDVLSNRQSHWVSLEAPSGWGKTRIGRELYAHLASSQEPPRYWPPVIDDPHLGRKATNPVRVDREAGSLPEFLWWGIACSTRFGVPEDALRRDLAQLEAHSLFVEAAWRALVSVRKRISLTLVEARQRLAEDGVLDLISAGVPEFLGVTLPPLGVAARLARWTVTEAKEAIAVRRTIGTHTGIEFVDSFEIVEDTADLLSRLGLSGFPVVILIEDLHKADKALLALIDDLLRREGSLLVISTTLPDTMEADDALAGLLNRHRERLHRVTEAGVDPPGKPFATGAGLFELEKDARSRILHAVYPKIEAATREAILSTYVNPWALELFSQIPKYQIGSHYRTTGGDLWLPMDERNRLPQRIEDLYKSIWDDLPWQIRFVLAIAHIIVPSHIDSIEGRGEYRWADSVLRNVIDRLGHPNAEQSLGALDEAPTAYAWIRRIDADLRAFAESPQGDIAEEYGYELLDEELHNPKSKILNALAQSLLDPSREAALPDNSSRSVLALFSQGYVSDHNTVARAIDALLVSLQGYPRELPERIRLFDRFCSLEMSQVGGRLGIPDPAPRRDRSSRRRSTRARDRTLRRVGSRSVARS